MSAVGTADPVSREFIPGYHKKANLVCRDISRYHKKDE